MKLPSLKFYKKSKKEEQAQEQAQAVTNDPNKDKNPAEVLSQGMLNVRDIIAPSAIEVDFSYIKIGNTYYRTLFISGYPRFVGANWLSPIINFDHTLDMSMFYYPVKSKGILDDLRRKITEMEATTRSNIEKGKIVDPGVDIALKDAKNLQEQLVKGVEKFFQFSFYITIPADSLEELENVTKKLESTLGSLLLISKTATLQMEEAFQSTVPVAADKMLITRNMDTTSLATTFPFTSSDLTSDDGIMYGINRHNGSLVIFDRFSLENANTVVFAKSGSGKSYFVKLEALRLMVFGAEVMIIDPEEEYRPLAEAVGGNYISFGPSSPHKINPFDLSGVAVEGENELGQKLLSLHTLLKLMLGELTPTEEAILDRALIETYRIKGITNDPDTQRGDIEPPVMEDLYKVLLGASEPEAKGMAERLEKYIRGSMTGIFDSQSSIDLNNKMTVFSTKRLEDTIRPIAFYIILDFVWTRIRKNLRKRILIVEEAWYLLENEDSARFIYGIAKRARKYYLGLTTITQDVDDFLTSEYGKVIVTNSSLQILLKQHPAAIDRVAETFYLSEGEKRLLLAADRGEGLFFAGANHISIKIKASEEEHKLITTNPEEILKLRQEGKLPTGGFANPPGTPAPSNPPTGPQGQQPRPAYTPAPKMEHGKYETMDADGKPKEGFAPKPQSQAPQQNTPASTGFGNRPTEIPPVAPGSPAALKAAEQNKQKEIQSDQPKPPENNPMPETPKPNPPAPQQKAPKPPAEASPTQQQTQKPETAKPPESKPDNSGGGMSFAERMAQNAAPKPEEKKPNPPAPPQQQAPKPEAPKPPENKPNNSGGGMSFAERMAQNAAPKAEAPKPESNNDNKPSVGETLSNDDLPDWAKVNEETQTSQEGDINKLDQKKPQEGVISIGDDQGKVANLS